MPDEQPDPRSPRQGRDADNGGLPTSTGNPNLAMPMPPGGFPGVFIGEPVPPRPQRSLSSMLFLTMFFFFMSQNGNNQPLGTVGPDGELRERVTELSLLRQQVKEYEGFINGTGNWTEVSGPEGRRAGVEDAGCCGGRSKVIRNAQSPRLQSWHHFSCSITTSADTSHHRRVSSRRA